jgi:hypothetical protein
MKRDVNTRRAKPLADLAGEDRLNEIERQVMESHKQRAMEDRPRSGERGQREAMDDDDDE